MNIEDKIYLADKFQLRDYQQPIWDALQSGFDRLLLCLPRRSGKDFLLWNYAIFYAMQKTRLVHYVLPTYGQANRAVFSGLTIDGQRFIDQVPATYLKNINQSDMKIILKNNSVIQCLGGDTHNISIRGTNPSLVILSEYAYMQDASILDTVTPIISANNGTLIIASTPNGKNHFWHTFIAAKDNPNWFVYHRTINETNHIPEEQLNEEKNRMSPELYAQEYLCSFERGISGAVFGNCLNKLKQAEQITHVAYDPMLLVHCAIDIGVNDATTIIWFQTSTNGEIIKIIDCYRNTGLGLDHYVEIMQKKPYWGRMGKFFAPHDLSNREWGSGAVSRYEIARQLGVTFTILKQQDLDDGIENVMMMFPRFWIDQTRCKSLVDAIENYYKQWDETRQIYSRKPVHNWASDYCDALRYLCQGVALTKQGMAPGDLERERARAMSIEGELPRVFRQDHRYDRR